MRLSPDIFFESGLYSRKINNNGNFPFLKCRYYRRVKFQYRGGRLKRRVVFSPSRKLLVIQQKLRDYVLLPFIQRKKVSFDFAHGGIKERSILTHTAAHKGNRFFFVTDIYQAYYSIKLYYLRLIFYWLEFYDDPVEAIMQLTTYKRRLIIGAATSPLLFNLFFSVIDKKIMDFLRDYYSDTSPVVYTRYYDDLVFSSLYPISPDVRSGIKRILAEHMLLCHDRKTHYQDVFKKPLEVVGLSISKKGIGITKQRRRHMEGLLRMAIDNPLKWRQLVAGKMSLFVQVYGWTNLPLTIDKLIEAFDMAVADV